MNEPIIVCPNCKAEIKLTESLAAPLIEATRSQYEQKIRHNQAEISQREAAVRTQLETLAKEKESFQEQLNLRVDAERQIIAEEEARKARSIASSDLERKDRELSELREVLDARESKLAEAQNAQAELIRKQRELDDAKREMELTIETRVQGSLAEIRGQAKKDVEQEFKLKVLEKEHTISAMQGQIEELKRRAEQGSEQLQGEVQELELEAVLRSQFPQDVIDSVPKGEHGGDLLHHVIGPAGLRSGTLLWEAKRTKNWSEGWLSKLRDDQRRAKAEVAIIVSRALPKEIESFGLREGVWVTDPRFAVPIAVALRQFVIEVAVARQASEGQQTKMELLYQYLIGPRFRQRVEAIVEKFSEMQEDLNKERKAMTRLWAKREEQIRGVLEATAGMYGDLQGIAGKSLGELKGLELKALESGSPQVPKLD